MSEDSGDGDVAIVETDEANETMSHGGEMKTYPVKTVLSLSFLALGLISYRSVKPQTQSAVTKTAAIEVVSLSESDGGSDLLLRNQSSKNINGYSITFDGGGSRIVDLSVGTRVIAPNQQFMVHLPPAAQAKRPVVMYVTFEDGTGDGDPAGLVTFQDRRAGRSAQLQRIIPLLNSAVASGDFEQLKTQIQTLPEAGDKSLYANLGMREAKEDVLLELNKLNKSDPKPGLIKMLQLTNNNLSRLQVKTIKP
jgi:hypothetical protein